MLLRLAIGVVLAVLSSHAQAASEPVVFARGECCAGRCWPELRIGALAGPTRAGTIFAFAQGIVNVPVRQSYILLKRSSDGGYSWSNATVAAYVATGTSGNPAPVVLADNTTLLLFFQHMTAAHHPGYSAFVTRSTDDGASFDSPLNVTAQVKVRQTKVTPPSFVELPTNYWWDVGPPGGVVDATGRLVQCMNVEDPPVRDGGRPYVYSASSADGRVWTASRGRQPLFGDGSGECQLARVGDGGKRLVMFARSQRPGTSGDDSNGTQEHVALFSNDGGADWSAPQRLRDIPGPNCEGSILGVPPAAQGASSNWSLIATAPSNTDVLDSKGLLLRAGLAMYASGDGLSWQRCGPLIDVNASAYSSLLLYGGGSSGKGGGDSREVLCLFEAGEGTDHAAPYKTIRLARRPIATCTPM